MTDTDACTPQSGFEDASLQHVGDHVDHDAVAPPLPERPPSSSASSPFEPMNHNGGAVVGQSDFDPYENAHYFGEYGKPTIHVEMLQDQPRVEAYARAIELNKHLFQDRVVLDVGCGTGILSCLAAKAGARRVFAVEASEMACTARLIVAMNRLQDVVEIFHQRIEEVVLPEAVDIIVSEWMGCFLYAEGMLDSVWYARDHLMKPGGLLFPSRARLFLAPISMAKYFQKNMWFLSDVAGLDLSPLIQQALKHKSRHTWRSSKIKANQVIADAHVILDLDLNTATVRDLQYSCVRFEFTPKDTTTFHGFATWIEVVFGPYNKDSSDVEVVSLCTSPFHPKTHWGQELFLFATEQPVSPASRIAGAIEFGYHQVYRRHVAVDFTFRTSPTQYFQKRFAV